MMNRILTFAGKARQRGPGYVRDLVTYHAHAARYRLGNLTRGGGTGSMLGSPPRPAFHFNADDVSAIVAAVPESIQQATTLEAHQCVEQRFSFRGLGEVHFPRAIDWNFAPEGNTSWSWDLNRHRFFLTLAAAHHYAEDAAGKLVFKNKLIELWGNWMRRNPPGQGLNWQSPFEVAARLRNWIWAYYLLAASTEVNPLFFRKAWRGLREHAAYLADHLEYHWPNNHLLLEALSLYEFAVVFRGHGGERYIPLASRVLETQVRQQVLCDGVHSELCPMYHEIVASELGAFTLLCRRLGHSLPLATEERIFSMKRFSAALRRSDGSISLLGDSSFPDTCLRFDTSSPVCSDLSYWLRRGEASTTRLSSGATEQALSIKLFTAAGLGVLRSTARQAHLTFDFGPFSRCASANHGHSDALSFELHAAGRPWIVDSGFFHFWNTGRKPPPPRSTGDELDGPDWSRYFRSTTAHNTLVIDGREQNELSEHHDIGDKARARLNSYRSNSSEVTISAEVEPHWALGEVTHRREISLTKSGEITIRDQVLGTTFHKLQWLLHFAVDLEVELRDSTTVVAKHNDDVLICQLRSQGPIPHLRLVRGEISPLQGWVALSSARVAPAWVLVVEVGAALPYELDFLFSILTCKNELATSSGSRNELELVLPELVETHV